MRIREIADKVTVRLAAGTSHTMPFVLIQVLAEQGLAWDETLASSVSAELHRRKKIKKDSYHEIMIRKKKLVIPPASDANHIRAMAR